MKPNWQVGIDVGGTFTDIVAFNPASGDVRTAKVGSRTDDPVAGLCAALSAVGISWEEVANLVHGTTIVTNAIIENRSADVALITTEGF
ncbi:MAG: hydantoinase/oxoprolinase N-terminal domain-containing protein, partial [Acidiferrobacterales bacterium]